MEYNASLFMFYSGKIEIFLFERGGKTMQQLGNVLTTAREKMGLSIEDVAQITKIRSKYIQALETGNMDAIPGKVYALGFLKSYCEVLNLDYKELQEYFQANYPEKDEFAKSLAAAVPEKKNIQLNNLNNKRVVLFALLGACVLLGGIYFLVRNMGKEENQPPVIPPVIEQDPATTPEPAVPETPDVFPDENNSGVASNPPNEEPSVPDLPNTNIQEGVDVVIEATGKCWTKVTIDEGNVKEETLNAGDMRSYHGDNKIVIRFGNAGAVKVTVNGESIGSLGDNGKVVTREFLAQKEK